MRNLENLKKARVTADVSIATLFPFGVLAKKARDPAFDRDIAITMAVVVEHGLENAIVIRLGDLPEATDILFTGQAPIVRDFSDKIRLACLLGIIGPKTSADLGVVRVVRNAFAHSMGYLDFDVPEIDAALSTIDFPNRYPNLMESHSNKDNRERFIQTIFRLSLFLHVFPSDRNASELTERSWAAILA